MCIKFLRGHSASTPYFSLKLIFKLNLILVQDNSNQFRRDRFIDEEKNCLVINDREIDQLKNNLYFDGGYF